MEEKRKICKNCVDCTDRIPFFNLLSKEELEIVNKDRFSVHFKAEELILKQGTSATHVISLINGIAKVYVEGTNDRNLLLRLIRPWTLIDEPGINTSGKNQFSIAALTDTQVCFIDANHFNEVLSNNSRFACALIKHRSHNSIFCLNRMVSLTQKQMLGRMADGLLYLGKEIFSSDKFDMSLSRQDIADLTAMSKDSAIRVLKEMERDRIIAMNGKSISILDMEQLNNLSARG